MDKPMPAPHKRLSVSGIAGHPRAPYGNLKAGSYGESVASPAVILVVEDTEDLRWCVAQYLRVAGFEVVESANAKEALAAIDTGTHIDLVFTDIHMPGAMDGVALARWLAVNRPLLPVILTSGEARPELQRTVPHCRFVRKPYSLDALEHDVRALVGTSVVQ
jgi:CheY-like chemotaxis protein